MHGYWAIEAGTKPEPSHACSAAGLLSGAVCKDWHALQGHRVLMQLQKHPVTRGQKT
jgi:hypothetical protein